jgi:hypothetical protein
MRREASVFAVVTHPAGGLSALGHPHLIVADDYSEDLDVELGDLSATRFSMVVEVRELVVNPPSVLSAVVPRLKALGVLDDDMPVLSTSEREAMQSRITSPSQLNASAHPRIEMRLRALRREMVEVNGRDFPWLAEIEFTVRGVTVMREVPLNVFRSGKRVQAVALGAFRFSEFGMEPFSAALGLLRNDDTFHVYVELAAEPATDGKP